jgi:uncharacterized membrane protein
MPRWGVLLGGMGIGATMMYALDPDRGRRRRALARDKATHLWHAEREVFEKGVRDLRHRAEGAAAGIRKRLATEPVPDRILEERVRAGIGRHVSHPSSIDVSCRSGMVVLSGPVLTREADELVRTVRHIPGVHEVEDRLDRHDRAGDIPGLQGPPHPRVRPMLLRETWPPALRIVGAGAGLGLGAYGLARGGPMGMLSTVMGGALVLRVALNQPTSQIVGLSEKRGKMMLQKTMTIHASPEQVFKLWSNPETFPHFMENVRDVRVSDDRKRAHWIMDGPAGSHISWDAEITRFEDNRLIAWRTLPGSTIEHTGTIQVEPQGDDKTRLSLRLTYAPPAGVLGQAVATLLGHNPKRALDADLVRMKSILEDKKTTAHHRQVGLSDLH